MKLKLRTITVRNRRYLRLDDVAALLRLLGSKENVDTQDRLDDAARKIEAQSALFDHARDLHAARDRHE